MNPKMDEELDNIRCFKPTALGLIDWKSPRHEGRQGENRFNTDCSKKNGGLLLDCRLVKLPHERGGIEFCDLMSDHASRLNLIHVKKASGAALRALFAQGHVSAKLYSDSADFRTLVYDGTLTGGDALTPAEKKELKALKTRQKREFRIVFAIFDDTAAHTVSAGAASTSEMLEGTLTPFAKVDLLDRGQSIRSMGFDVAVTRITPYP